MVSTITSFPSTVTVISTLLSPLVEGIVVVDADGIVGTDGVED